MKYRIMTATTAYPDMLPARASAGIRAIIGPKYGTDSSSHAIRASVALFSMAIPNAWRIQRPI
jgi:hypothetical protein